MEEEVHASFRSLPLALRDFPSAARILILEKAVGGGGQGQGRGAGRGEEGGMEEGRGKEAVTTLVSELASSISGEVLLLTGGRPGAEAYSGKLWVERRRRLGRAPALLHGVSVAALVAPEEERLPEGFWGWEDGETVRCGERRGDALGNLRQHCTVELSICTATGRVECARGGYGGGGGCGGPLAAGLEAPELAGLGALESAARAIEWVRGVVQRDTCFTNPGAPGAARSTGGGGLDSGRLGADTSCVGRGSARCPTRLAGVLGSRTSYTLG